MGAGTLSRSDILRRGDILGVILAGGQSRRFGSDKAAAQLGGSRLIERVAAKASRQTAALVVSGRDYGLGLPVIPDTVPGQGPLIGVLSALEWAKATGFSALATFSCDAPFFPPDLVARLAEGVRSGKACSVVRSGGLRHPIFAVWRTSALDRLRHACDAGIRALKAAQDEVEAAEVSFPTGPGPGGDMFFNINSRDDLLPARTWLAEQGARDLHRLGQSAVG